MRCTSKLAIRLAALLVMLPWCVGAADSQGADRAVIQEEISKQHSIYQGRGDALLKGYVIDRTLASYAAILPDDFERSLARLGPQDRWLDIGAGEGRAILDYYAPQNEAAEADGLKRRAGKGSSVAISIEDRRTPEWYRTAAGLEPQKIQYFFGRPLREYSLQELGTFQVITDVVGGFSYTSTIDRFMETALALLAPGGSFYTLLQDVHSEEGGNRPHYDGSPYLTEITAANGLELKMCAWLKRIGCVQVSCQLKTDWIPAIEVYQIRKTCEDVKVPALAGVHYQAGTPPERRFKLLEPQVGPR